MFYKHSNAKKFLDKELTSNKMNKQYKGIGKISTLEKKLTEKGVPVQ